MLFSVIVPVFNRPDEIEELLESLCQQTYSIFEVIIVEDGSEIKCNDRVDKYRGRLNVSYYYKENSGQGFSRNYGFEKAKGDYFVVFDSDCIIPPHYFETVKRKLSGKSIDAWGGPDRSHQSFSPIQKAIGYAMTSPFTTGGIRGGKKQIGTFHPRSFNMGISREVYQKTGGYKITRVGEDLEFSIRIIRSGFRVVLINEAYVYHKRRTNFRQFYNQLHFFGRARVNIQRFYPGEVKAVHLLPAMFVISLPLLILTVFIHPGIFQILVIPYILYTAIILLHAYHLERNFYVACLSAAASWIQLFAYGTGFLSELYHDNLNNSED